MAALIERLGLWVDAQRRSGPMNMALDEALLKSATEPFLRLYRWDGAWVSFGFFKPLAEVRGLFPDPDLSLVRRRTGGGVVDHRQDLTYSLGIPKGHLLERTRGPESYRLIHEALAAALRASGVEAWCGEELQDNGDARCFANPVQFDLTGPGGLKLSGAGQHRGRAGLLHQGSIQNCQPEPGWETRFAELLAEQVLPMAPPCESLLSQAGDIADKSFASESWTQRR